MDRPHAVRERERSQRPIWSQKAQLLRHWRTRPKPLRPDREKTKNQRRKTRRGPVCGIVSKVKFPVGMGRGKRSAARGWGK